MNRTLTLQPDERPWLEDQVLRTTDLGSRDIRDTLINADMAEALRYVPDHSAHLIILDPPYNLSKDFHGMKFAQRTPQQYEDYLRSWMSVVCDKLRPDGTLYMCGDWHCTAAMQRVIEEHLTIINRISWQREKGRGAAHNWKNATEDIWMAVADAKNYHFDLEAVMMKRRVLAPYRVDGIPKDWSNTENGKFRLTCPSNFWDDISVPFWSMPENTDHPTQKPEKLFAKLILASSCPGDLVLDPFAGSGTTAVTAKKLSRHYCAIEINHEYCLWAAKRLALAEIDPSIQGYNGGVFWERNSLPQQRMSSVSKPATATSYTQNSLF